MPSRTDVNNPDAYLTTVTSTYQRLCDRGDSREHELRNELWRAALAVFRVADNPEPWLDLLRDASFELIKASWIETTITSARNEYERS
jgi:hypothetical protein